MRKAETPAGGTRAVDCKWPGFRHVPLAAWVKGYINPAGKRKGHANVLVAAHESVLGRFCCRSQVRRAYRPPRGFLRPMRDRCFPTVRASGCS